MTKPAGATKEFSTLKEVAMPRLSILIKMFSPKFITPSDMAPLLKIAAFTLILDK